MIKAKNVDQATFMLRQFNELARFKKAAKKEKPTTLGNDRRVCVVEFADASDDGAEPDSTIELTPAMGRKLIPFIERMLRDELLELGVDVGTR